MTSSEGASSSRKSHGNEEWFESEEDYAPEDTNEELKCSSTDDDGEQSDESFEAAIDINIKAKPASKMRTEFSIRQFSAGDKKKKGLSLKEKKSMALMIERLSKELTDVFTKILEIQILKLTEETKTHLRNDETQKLKLKLSEYERFINRIRVDNETMKLEIATLKEYQNKLEENLNWKIQDYALNVSHWMEPVGERIIITMKNVMESLSRETLIGAYLNTIKSYLLGLLCWCFGQCSCTYKPSFSSEPTTDDFNKT